MSRIIFVWNKYTNHSFYYSSHKTHERVLIRLLHLIEEREICPLLMLF